MNIHKLADSGRLYNVHTGQHIGRDDEQLHGIAQTAKFRGSLRLGYDTQVVGRANIGADCRLGDGARIEQCVWMGDTVFVGSHAKVRDYATVFAGARIQDNSDVRPGTIIGPHVIVPYEAQIGSDAVIPTSKTIAVLGRLGTSRRIMTIYGSDQGPLYSAGCQYGDSEVEITERIVHGIGTSPDSAEHYQEHLDIIHGLGEIVQRHYEAEATLIEELRGQVETLRAK